MKSEDDNMNEQNNAIHGRALIKTTELEKELAEWKLGASVEAKEADKERAKVKELEEKLAVAREALEFIQTYKHPDYFSHSRGSVFNVAREALEKIKG